MMNQEDIFKKIGQILNELSDQYQYLAQNPQVLNELELELFLANANFLTDHVQIIQKINSHAVQKALPEHTEVEEEIAVEQPQIPVFNVNEAISPTYQGIDELLYTQSEMPVVEEPAQHAAIEQEEPEVVHTTPRLEDDIFKPDIEPSTFEFILNEKPSSNLFEFEEKSVDEIFDRPLSKEEELIIAQKQKLREMDSLEVQQTEEDEIGPEPFLVEEPVIYKEPVYTAPEPIYVASEPVKEAEPEIIQTELSIVELTPELVVEEEPVTKTTITKPTLNDILSGNTAARNINYETSRAPIKDLKQAISLNDKMRYIKDLFNGYNLAYAEAIDLLNKMPDFKSADSFLQSNYAIKHNWAEKQATADQFYELLNQRFPIK